MRINREADKAGATDRVRLVVVPAYNFSTVFLDACRDLSLSARTNVLVTNAAGKAISKSQPNGEKCLPDSKLFFLGREYCEMKEHGIEMIIAELREDLWIIDIDLARQDRALDLTKTAFFRSRRSRGAGQDDGEAGNAGASAD